MTLEQLIAAFRGRTDDLAEPFLWSDEEITGYLNEAVNEACARANLIYDESTAAICSLAVSANNPVVPLSSKITRIERVKLAGQRLPLDRAWTDTLDEETPGWEGVTGTPSRFIDRESSLRLVPTPAAADTLKLGVYRMPLVALEDTDDEPEINERHHPKLLDWALSLGYRKRDSDAYDEQKADKFESLFTAAFGPRPSARVQRARRERRPPHIAFNPSW